VAGLCHRLITMAIQLAFSLTLGILTEPLGTLTADLVGVAVGNSLAAPLVAVAWTLTYIDLRELRRPPERSTVPTPHPDTRSRKMTHRLRTTLAAAACARAVFTAGACGSDDTSPSPPEPPARAPARWANARAAC